MKEVDKKEGLLETVAKFIACDNQSLAVANKALFRNCLVMMRQKTLSSELPSTHDISVYIHNHFVDQLKQLKAEILVSTRTSW
ncbi:hypothetical protein L208DRAFT_1293537 [Tricholoma matsutake]|nr:hypothetical protein L208DRAFT_1293537 [Tricholoma matsutake 945]